MKRLLPILFSLIVLAGCAHQVTPPQPPPINKDFPITATWNYDFTNFAACSTTLTKGCISGFTWGYLQGTTQVQLHAATTAICTGATQPETCVDKTNSQLPMGNIVFYQLTTFVDNSDNNGITGVDQSAPVTVTAGPGINLSIALQ